MIPDLSYTTTGREGESSARMGWKKNRLKIENSFSRLKSPCDRNLYKNKLDLIRINLYSRWYPDRASKMKKNSDTIRTV